MKHKNLQETGSAPRRKHLQKSKFLSFSHGFSWLEKECDFSPPFSRAASKHLFLLSALNPWKNKSHPHWVTSRNTGISRELHNVRWQQESSAARRKSPERGLSPHIFPFEMCCDAGHHIEYSVIIAIDGGQFLSMLKTWPLS